MQKRILIVEDDRTLARAMHDNLVLEGFAVDVVEDCSAAAEKLRASSPDLILLDLMLPGGDGFELCRTIRERNKAPVVIVSARGQKADKLKGLDLGADDYITKPFDIEELLARIRAVLRRGQSRTVSHARIGRLNIDFRARTATSGSDPVHLTIREFEVLSYLAERRETIVKRSDLLREVWGYSDDSIETRSVDHAITRLRKKIEPDPSNPRYILTAHRDGYCLCFKDDERSLSETRPDSR